MKKILCFLLILALAYADTKYSPKWSSCGTDKDIWQPVSVVFDKKPKPGKAVTATACGVMKETRTVGSFELQVKAELNGQYVPYYSMVVDDPQEKVAQGNNYCPDYTVNVPLTASGECVITAKPLDSNTKSVIGCVQFPVTF